MTDPLVNVEGPQPGDRVQVEARGEILKIEDRNGVPWAQIWTDPGPTMLWLPVDMLVLLDPRTTS